jgi:hypothetical protein
MFSTDRLSSITNHHNATPSYVPTNLSFSFVVLTQPTSMKDLDDDDSYNNGDKENTDDFEYNEHLRFSTSSRNNNHRTSSSSGDPDGLNNSNNNSTRYSGGSNNNEKAMDRRDNNNNNNNNVIAPPVETAETPQPLPMMLVTMWLRSLVPME